jgi:hypothetical protein
MSWEGMGGHWEGIGLFTEGGGWDLGARSKEGRLALERARDKTLLRREGSAESALLGGGME